VKPRAKPLLVYDGECSFCLAWIARWRRITGDAVDYAPYQDVASDFPEIPRERFVAAVQLIEPDGRSEAAEAVLRSLARAPGRAWLLELYRKLPGFAPVSEWCYRLVASHRPAAAFLTRWIWGRHVVPPGEGRTCWIFLRLLGVVYGVAFASLWVQITGLCGTRGILPAGEFLVAVHRSYGALGYWLAPTVCWIGSGDAFLQGLCAAGVVLALLLACGIAPKLALAGLWIGYLSLVTVGRNFMWFQWDSLLLETGFLAIFLAPAAWWTRPHEHPAPGAPLWLLRWLLFRLVLSSAIVKLASGDPTWRDLTALVHHYETQPLPPWTAWYAHHLPASFQRASAVVMFVIEGLVPFGLFAPRRIRFAAAGAIIALELLIAVSGNYAFFNLLTIALCVLVLDDGVWPGRRGAPAPGTARSDPLPRWLVRATAALLVLVSLVPLGRALSRPGRWLAPLDALYRLVSPFRLVNSYGLFAVMTVRRPEIVVEGSTDGSRWEAYEFRYKPGRITRRPGFVAPHQPRLDWQMWFAALRDFRGEPWFLYFCERLLQGSPPVLSLLGRNPFPEAPPRFVRAELYDYRFTDSATRRATGAWWQRRWLGPYIPTLTLDAEGRLAPAEGIGEGPGAP